MEQKRFLRHFSIPAILGATALAVAAGSTLSVRLLVFAGLLLTLALAGRYDARRGL